MVQVQPDQASPYAPRPDGSEGIGSYARKVAQAGLGPMPNPQRCGVQPPCGTPACLPVFLLRRAASENHIAVSHWCQHSHEADALAVHSRAVVRFWIRRKLFSWPPVQIHSYTHPSMALQAAKARLEAAIAQGYDPDAEYRSMLGRLMTDDLDSPELDEGGQGPAAPGQPGSTTPDLDADFNEQLSEDEIREEQEVNNPVSCSSLSTVCLMALPDCCTAC